MWHHSVVTMISAAVSTGEPIFDVLIQYGAVGVIAVMALIAVRVLYNRIAEQAAQDRARADRLEEELLKLHEAVRTEYLGTLAKATEAIADALAARRRG